MLIRVYMDVKGERDATRWNELATQPPCSHHSRLSHRGAPGFGSVWGGFLPSHNQPLRRGW
ncbi:hypothetical protein EYF80_039576 [Liparis tanakae]|uniref:Uncharacterized protein n=1 Tax=Liparis tanakae TaxID=230148 RepID=A0A4Z2G9R0_9TELE|nr:hypothetical protein EYF80_039576 [Liparis tanakae]